MVVGEDGALPLPWLAAPLAEVQASHRGHALMVHGTPGSALAFGLTLAQAWLCETAGATRPCGRCGSCRLVQSHLHPDLMVLLPETLRREHDWPLADDRVEGDDSKRKPSRQIRIDEVRGLIDWATRTSGRGRAKVAVLHPAEALNLQSASALLKTLEEPPAGTRLVLTTGDPALLLATVRSRCQRLRLAEPPTETAVAWLSRQGVAQPQVLLAATSGRPLDALALSRSGVDGTVWSAVPGAVLRANATAFVGWPLPLALDALHKLCHDALSRRGGGAARYFPNECVPATGNLELLAAWSRELCRVARHDEHPWNEGLLLDSLVGRGAQALAAAPASGPAAPRRLDTLPS